MCPASKISNRAEVTRSKRVILGSPRATCPPSLLFDSIRAEVWASSYTRAVNSSESTRLCDTSLLGIKQDGASVDTVFGIERCSRCKLLALARHSSNQIELLRRVSCYQVECEIRITKELLSFDSLLRSNVTNRIILIALFCERSLIRLFVELFI